MKKYKKNYHLCCLMILLQKFSIRAPKNRSSIIFGLEIRVYLLSIKNLSTIAIKQDYWQKKTIKNMVKNGINYFQNIIFQLPQDMWGIKWIYWSFSFFILNLVYTQILILKLMKNVIRTLLVMRLFLQIMWWLLLLYFFGFLSKILWKLLWNKVYK